MSRLALPKKHICQKKEQCDCYGEGKICIGWFLSHRASGDFPDCGKFSPKTK